MAEYVGLEAEVILGYEEGTMSVPLDDIFSLSNCLNIPPDEIVQFLYKLVTLQEEDSKSVSEKLLG